MAGAWKNLKLTFEAFDYQHEPTPQLDAIRTFLKRQLSAGNVVVMMIQKACSNSIFKCLLKTMLPGLFKFDFSNGLLR